MDQSAAAPMNALERVARWVTLGGLAACVAGIATLFLASAGEVMAGTAPSIEDGYWLGRLPWNAVGVDLAVIGATVAVIAGTVAAWVSGGWVRRILAAGGLAVTAFWWSIAMLTQGGGAWCPTCPPPGPDSLTFAYSLPELTVRFLLLPALFVSLVALAPARRRPPAVTP